MAVRRRIIGFSGRAGSGKSAAALWLVQRHGFIRVRFAGPLKAMGRAVGLTEAQVDGDLKEAACDLLCGKTPRFFMQRLGTEFGRDMIGQDFWMRAWLEAVNRLPPSANVVADDCRFPNEAQAIRDLGGFVVRIVRPDVAKQSGSHISEMPTFEPDAEIINDDSLLKLCVAASAVALAPAVT